MPEFYCRIVSNYQRHAQPFLDAVARSVRDSATARSFLLMGTEHETSYSESKAAWTEQRDARDPSDKLACPFWANYWSDPCASCDCRVGGSKSMEIDALFILRNPVGRTLAVHVEFKRDGESFLPGQAEAYRNRARCYRDERRPRPKVLKHNDFVTILFCGTGTDVVSMRGYFDRVITHAEAHQWILNYPNPANPGGPTMRERLAALVAFEPVCRAASFRATTGDPVTEPGVYLGVTYSAEVSRFIEMAYEQGWVRALPWSDWRQTVRGNALMHDPDAMADATADELACVLTTCIRADRFCDGYLADAFEAGLIGRAAIRAKQLLEAAT